MEISGKVWGSTELVLRTTAVEIHRIIIKPGGYCSTHYHKYKNNMFYVESGEIEIHTLKDYGLNDKTVLKEGQTYTVKPGEKHRFYSSRLSTVYEIYYLDFIKKNDIVRENVGGCKISEK
jgi:mannose-6-phosphate isomerase-like protein (cupin superfamily)